MQAFKTVTRTPAPVAVESVHYTVAHAVLENAQKAVADLCLDYDCTGARQYIMYANVFASLTDCYYSIRCTRRPNAMFCTLNLLRRQLHLRRVRS